MKNTKAITPKKPFAEFSFVLFLNLPSLANCVNIVSTLECEPHHPAAAGADSFNDEFNGVKSRNPSKVICMYKYAYWHKYVYTYISFKSAILILS